MRGATLGPIVLVPGGEVLRLRIVLFAEARVWSQRSAVDAEGEPPIALGIGRREQPVVQVDGRRLALAEFEAQAERRFDRRRMIVEEA